MFIPPKHDNKNPFEVYIKYGYDISPTLQSIVAFYNEERLLAAMSALKSYRDGNTRWRRFPFYYTLLALSEMDLPSAIEEMRYAAPIMERYLKRHAADSEYSKRRRLLSERILAKC
jgi:hypothetical protein